MFPHHSFSNVESEWNKLPQDFLECARVPLALIKTLGLSFKERREKLKVKGIKAI